MISRWLSWLYPLIWLSLAIRYVGWWIPGSCDTLYTHCTPILQIGPTKVMAVRFLICIKSDCMRDLGLKFERLVSLGTQIWKIGFSLSPLHWDLGLKFENLVLIKSDSLRLGTQIWVSGFSLVWFFETSRDLGLKFGRVVSHKAWFFEHSGKLDFVLDCLRYASICSQQILE